MAPGGAARATEALPGHGGWCGGRVRQEEPAGHRAMRCLTRARIGSQQPPPASAGAAKVPLIASCTAGGSLESAGISVEAPAPMIFCEMTIV